MGWQHGLWRCPEGTWKGCHPLCRPHRPPTPPPCRLMLGPPAWRRAGLPAPSVCQLRGLAAARCTSWMPLRIGAPGSAAPGDMVRANGHCYLEHGLRLRVGSAAPPRGGRAGSGQFRARPCPRPRPRPALAGSTAPARPPGRCARISRDMHIASPPGACHHCLITSDRSTHAITR